MFGQHTQSKYFYLNIVWMPLLVDILGTAITGASNVARDLVSSNQITVYLFVQYSSSAKSWKSIYLH